MKRIKWLILPLVICLVMAMPSAVFAAVPLPFLSLTIDFAAHYGSMNVPPENDVLMDIRPDGSNYILAGYANSDTTDFAPKTTSTYGGGAIIKVDASGSVIWGRVLEDALDPLQMHMFMAVEPVSDGYIAVGNKHTAATSDRYALAVKFDFSGNVVWQKTFGGSSVDQFSDICRTADGNVALAGTAYRFPRVDYGGLQNGMVLKLNAATGETMWATSIGGTLTNEEQTFLYSVEPTADGGFVVCGQTRNNDGDFYGPSLGYFQAYVIKLNAGGVRQWTSMIGGSDTDSFSNVIELASGKYMAVGSTRSSDGDFPGIASGSDAVAAILGSTGALIAQCRLSGPSDEGFRRVVPTAAGGIVFGSTESSTGIFTGISHGYIDGLVANISDTGSFNWITTFGGSEADAFFAGLRLTDNKVIAVGRTKSANGNLAGFPATDNEKMLLTAFSVTPVDTTGPSLDLVKDPAGATNGNVTITATATDASGVKQITLPDNTVVTGASATFTATANGDYTFKAEDTKGNITIRTVTVSNIDKVAPIITLGAYEATQPVDGDITVTASVNEGTLNATSHTFTENGSFEFVATDAAGNIARKTVTITNIAKTAPRIISVTGTQKTLASGRIELTISIVTAKYPAGAQVAFQLLDAEKRPLASPITGVALVGADGRAQLVVVLPDGFVPGTYCLSAGIDGQNASSKDNAIVILPAEIPQTGETGSGSMTLVQTLAVALIAAALMLALAEGKRRKRS